MPRNDGPHVKTCGDFGGVSRQTGKLCQQPAGFRTDHPGTGKCTFHGGSSPIKHGLYSKIQRPRVLEIQQQLEKDIKDGIHDPFDLVPEATLVRALTRYYCENWQDIIEALLAWNDHEYLEAESEERVPRPERIPSDQDLARLADTISRIVERADKVRSKSMYSPEVFTSTYSSMAVVLAEECKKAERVDIAEKVMEKWGRIQVQGLGGKK